MICRFYVIREFENGIVLEHGFSCESSQKKCKTKSYNHPILVCSVREMDHHDQMWKQQDENKVALGKLLLEKVKQFVI